MRKAWVCRGSCDSAYLCALVHPRQHVIKSYWLGATFACQLVCAPPPDITPTPSAPTINPTQSRT
jgi:hypothetical protein